LFPQEIIRCCDDLETALREYQSIVEVLISAGMSSNREGGIAEHLSHAFHKVRQSYIPLEPILGRRKRRIRRKGREFWEPWLDVPTFRGVRTVEDFQATFSVLDWLLLNDPYSGKKMVVHQELQGYFECIDAIRREAERRIQNAPDAYPNTSNAIVMENSLNGPEKCNEANQPRRHNKPTEKGKSLGRPPSDYEIQSYRAHLQGLKQHEIATIMKTHTGTPCDQSKVSRAIKKIDLLLKRGNSEIRSRILPVDPSKLEQGPRLDGRKPQR